MPHSSGGGSHGGGSHGGSHSHSSSSSGSSSSHVRNSYYPGSQRFVYYSRKKPHYFYADYDITATEKPSPLRYLLLLFYLPFFIAGFFLCTQIYHRPIKLENNYNSNIVIKDDAHVFSDNEEKEMKDTFKSFFDETGISVSVMTVFNEQWINDYTDLEKYAFDLYVNSFEDEKHWLIVYSEPILPKDNFNDWYWEGMQGNDTDNIITYDVADKFTENLQKYFVTETKYTKASAIVTAFNDITPTIMRPRFEVTFLVFAIFWLGFVCTHSFFMVFYDGTKKYREAVIAPMATTLTEAQSMEAMCRYCTGIYVRGIHLSCPHCGAPVELSSAQTNTDTTNYYQ